MKKTVSNKAWNKEYTKGAILIGTLVLILAIVYGLNNISLKTDTYEKQNLVIQNMDGMIFKINNFLLVENSPSMQSTMERRDKMLNDIFKQNEDIRVLASKTEFRNDENLKMKVNQSLELFNEGLAQYKEGMLTGDKDKKAEGMDSMSEAWICVNECRRLLENNKDVNIF